MATSNPFTGYASYAAYLVYFTAKGGRPAGRLFRGVSDMSSGGGRYIGRYVRSLHRIGYYIFNNMAVCDPQAKNAAFALYRPLRNPSTPTPKEYADFHLRGRTSSRLFRRIRAAEFPKIVQACRSIPVISPIPAFSPGKNIGAIRGQNGRARAGTIQAILARPA